MFTVRLQSCDSIFEPKLSELINQLRKVASSSIDWLVEQLTDRLASLSSPDDLFNFFADMRGSLLFDLWFRFFKFQLE